MTDVFVLQNSVNFNLFTEGGFGDRIVIFVSFFVETGIFADDDFFASVDIFYDTDNIDPLFIPSGLVAGINALQGFFFQISAPPFSADAFILLTTVYHKPD